MSKNRLTAWLHPALTLFALAGVFSLAGCGGGNGAPNNMFAPPAVTPTLTVLPATAVVFSGVPSTLTITSGTGPFSAFSSNSALLPVSSTVTNTIGLLASPVTTDQAVTLTIRDALGNQVDVPVTIHPSLLLPASITIAGNPVCGGSGAQLCSGQDGTATVQITGTAGISAAGRQVQFDVVLGTFSLLTSNSAAPAQSVTVTTDQNGLAAVTIRIPVNAPTQFGTIRATDVATGSSVIGQFTISQFVNGNSVLSVIPTGTTTFTGRDTATCSSGAQANFYIFGGTPPYMVATNFPTAVSLLGVPVLTSGGAFTVVTNSQCFTGLTFAITDAAGRTLLTPPTVDNVVGTAAPVVPLAINPTAYPIGAGTTTCSNNTFSFLISGGTGKYSASVSPQAGATGTATAPPPTGGTATVLFTGVAHGDFALNVTDGASVVTGTIHCAP
jgi:hypothetical protein